MANKKTQKDFYNEIIEVLNEVGRTDLVEFCEDRIDKLSRKATSKKPTKTQVANEVLKGVILDILKEQGAPITVSAILTDPRIEVGTSNQKISSLLKQMKEVGLVERTEEKGKALYSAVED